MSCAGSVVQTLNVVCRQCGENRGVKIIAITHGLGLNFFLLHLRRVLVGPLVFWLDPQHWCFGWDPQHGALVLESKTHLTPNVAPF